MKTKKPTEKWVWKEPGYFVKVGTDDRVYRETNGKWYRCDDWLVIEGPFKSAKEAMK